MKIESAYLSTSKMSKIIDINEKWLREHRGIVFKEGIHYYYPHGFKNCRWKLSAMLEWIENSSNESSNLTDDILDSICAL